MDVTLFGFVAVLGSASVLAFAAGRSRSAGVPPLEAWALADRRYGAVAVWLLLGGTIYTAYTFAAVPGLVYGAGAIGFFALPYTIVVYPLAFWMLPKLWSISAEHGFLTVADYARGRWGSHQLALAIALTGLLATMPYVALQLLGIRAVLEVGGVYPDGVAGDALLALVFGVLAVATYRSGLRAPALIAVVKGVVVVSVAIGLSVAALDRLGGPGGVFEVSRLDSTVGFSASLDPSLHAAYATLALGSAMALLCYPHVLTAAFSANSAAALRRAVVAMPLWTAILAVFGLLGLAARSAGIEAPLGNAEAALPMFVADLLPALLTGLVFGALAVGALVPAAVMSVAAGTLFTRNIYSEYLHPEATPRTQTRVARVTSLVVKVGALVFVFGLRGQDAINLQLLGGVWILQTFPAIALGLCTRWLHRGGVLAGWATGMIVGTYLVAEGGFSAVVDVGDGTQMYAAVVALIANLAVAVALTPLLDRLRISRGVDATASRGSRATTRPDPGRQGRTA
ncbi:sodium:solute symporter [Kribbella sp. NBC_01245]|uniref:sodium:solute symporter family protein n=1 Tax=Kribbella sp. NBC_01245 TaxID=2903578 RepID=UPI002E2A9C5D|nr:sodium:solute symporter [Kribbella sp. NBC_01245]